MAGSQKFTSTKEHKYMDHYLKHCFLEPSIGSFHDHRSQNCLLLFCVSDIHYPVIPLEVPADTYITSYYGRPSAVHLVNLLSYTVLVCRLLT